jgi:hypothetical protein
VPRQFHSSTPTQRLLTGLLCVLVFALGLVGRVPEWHAWLHAPATQSCAQGEHGPTADTHDPSCAISLLDQGTELPLLASLLSESLLRQECAKPPEATERPSFRDRLQPPGRAPPALA